MLRLALLPAFLTGIFCVGFTVLVSLFASVFSIVPVLIISFISGFLGSLFASYVVKGRR